MDFTNNPNSLTYSILTAHFFVIFADWLTRQHPNVVKDIQMHSQFLLDKMGFSEGDVPPGPGGPPQGDGDEFASDEVVNPSWFAPVKPMNNQVSFLELISGSSQNILS